MVGKKDPLLYNAIDSLQVGIDFYIKGTRETASKHAILNVFHSIELLLKAVLATYDPSLIYRHPKKPVTESSFTIGIDKAFSRCKAKGVTFRPEEEQVVDLLRKRRNKIEHHKYEPHEDDLVVLGRSLRFVHEFLPNHLDIELRELLDEEDYRSVREIIFDFEELLRLLEKEVQERTTPKSKDDLMWMVEPVECPNCGLDLVVVNQDEIAECALCRIEVEVDQCGRCGRYVSDHLGGDMCRSCWDEVMSSDRF